MLVALFTPLVRGWGKAAAPPAAAAEGADDNSAADQARQARRARLERLKLSALLKAARAAGVPKAAALDERESCQVGPKDDSWPVHSGGNTAI
jgi:hypothetical protein